MADDAAGWRVTARSLWRFLVVCWHLLPFAVAVARDRRRFLVAGDGRDPDPATRERRAERLRETLVELGPTFVKLGQVLSTRPDVLPAVYVSALSELQDRVPPADWADAREVIESEIGPVDERFDEFDTVAISGASLGQVYTARVDGERVAVKVLRPGIRRAVAADLRVVATLSPWLVRFAPPGQAFTLENLADEFAATLREETDYTLEARNLRTVRANFSDTPDVRIPEPLPDRSTDRVLTMEYVEGTKIDDVAELEARGIDRERLVRRLEEVYIEMTIEHGVFHADPHPGNLAVRDDGTIVFYDFGVVGRLDDRTRDRLLDFYVALARDDVDGVMDAFVALGALDPAADRELMGEAFGIVIERFRGADVDRYRIAELVTAFQTELYEFPMRLPRNLALLVRVTSVLEGVCRTLDPEFDFVAVITDYVRDRATSAEGRREAAERASAGARALAEGLVGVPPKLDAALAAAERGDATATIRLADDRGALVRVAGHVAATLLFGSGVVAAAVLYAVGATLDAAAPAALAAVLGVVSFLLLRRRERALPSAGPKLPRQRLRERQGRE